MRAGPSPINAAIEFWWYQKDNWTSVQGWPPRQAQQLSWIFEHTDVILLSVWIQGMMASWMFLECSEWRGRCFWGADELLGVWPGSSGAGQGADPKHLLGTGQRQALWANFESWLLCESPVAAVTSYPTSGDLKQQKLTVSQIWRPEVQSQGVSRAAFPPETLGEDPSWLFSFWWLLVFLDLWPHQLLPASVVTWPSSPYVCVLFSPYNPVGSHLNWISAKTLFPVNVTFCSSRWA